MGRQRESLLGARVDEYFRKQPDIFCFNAHGNAFQRKGIPDRVGSVGAIGFWIELKNPGEKAKPIQRAVHRKIERAGGNVRVCTTLEEVKEFVQELRSLALDSSRAAL